MPVSVKNISVAHTKPTLIFEIKDWLDQEHFAALEQSFPHKEKACEAQNKKFAFNKEAEAYEAFFHDHAAWGQFQRDLLSLRFIQDCNDIYNEYHKRDEQWILGKGFASNLINKYVFGKELVELRIEFSFMANAAFIVPHTDAPKKLVSLMLYFPSSDSKLTRENGTKFWRFKSDRSKNYLNWTNKKYSSDSYAKFYADAECFYKTEFVKNHLYGFLKTDLSWHSVDPVEAPKGGSRNSVNININKVDALGTITKRARKFLGRSNAFASSGLAYVRRKISI